MVLNELPLSRNSTKEGWNPALSEILDIVQILADLSGSGNPDMQKLGQDMSIYKFVNYESVSRTPVIRTLIKAQSGETVTWNILRFNTPLAIVYARGQIENTRIGVGAIGPIAEEIENLLG
jgi:hypothetical protein